MYIKNLKEAFLDHCSKFRLKKDHEQIVVIEKLVKFYENNFSKSSFLVRILKKNIRSLASICREMLEWEKL